MLRLLTGPFAIALMVAASGWGASDAPLNAVTCGADPTGARDCTRLLQELHSRGRPVFYPNGIYRFNGETLGLSGGLQVESRDGVVIRNDLAPDPVVVFDAVGNLVGLQQNPLEKDERELGPRGSMRSGSLCRPPLSSNRFPVAVDVLAHWYNDCGLECRRQGGGWIGWYYGSWAFHRSRLTKGEEGEPYDASRHPLLGFYRGDDPVVLDWQCYWLAEYGVRAVTLCCGRLDVGAWQSPANEGHWVYQLFHNVPNFARLGYVLWMPSPYLEGSAENRGKVENAWMALVDNVYLRYGNAYALLCQGKRYPVLYVYEGEALRGIFDRYQGARQTAVFLTRVAQRFQAAGYGGVALFVRHGTSGKLLDREALASKGVIYFDADYAADYAKGHSYGERVATYAPPPGKRTIVNTCTSRHSRAPHPSRWTCPGSSPELFGAQLRKAVAHVTTNGMTRVVTCYNVAEWAEGGPGLQPNRRDGFGYLQALHDAVACPATAEPRDNAEVQP